MKRKRWDDHYAQKARSEKWLARSVYKLQEIDKKFRLIRKGDYVLDLGCYPGSWSQYAVGKVGPGGMVMGIDLTRPAKIPFFNFKFIQADIFSPGLEERIRTEMDPANVVMSDLAPPTTGIKVTDSSRSMDLAIRARDIALALLRHKGNFLCKIFEGEDLKAFKSETSRHFHQVSTFRAQATRKGSREVYVLGMGLENRGTGYPDSSWKSNG